MALEITDSNYKEILAEGKPVVVDFWQRLLCRRSCSMGIKQCYR